MYLVAQRDEAPDKPQVTEMSRRETILLVDDDPGVRGVAARALREGGYLIIEAAGGSEAVAIAQRYPSGIHLVVSDVVMPEMGGAELVRRLREVLPSLKVLFISGYMDDQALRGSVSASEVELLQKPFTASELTEAVRRVLQVRVGPVRTGRETD